MDLSTPADTENVAMFALRHDEQLPTGTYCDETRRVSSISATTADVTTVPPRPDNSQLGSLPQADHHRNASFHTLEPEKALETSLWRRMKFSAQSSLLRHWWLETGACFISLAAIVAVVATLYPHQGRPLPQWPYNLSINTILSIYMTILKGAVLTVIAEGIGQSKWQWFQTSRPLDDLVTYDAATRGPLGAIALLWRLKTRNILSSVGALVAIMILLVDPFTQQIVRYYDCDVAMVQVEASVPRTQIYASTSSGMVPPELQAAVSTSVISPESSISFNCSSGNCTFPQEYSTIGYCHQCKDITAKLVMKSGFVKSNYTGLAKMNLQYDNGTNENVYQPLAPFLGNSNTSITTSLASGLSIQTNPGSDFNLTTMQAFQEPVGSEHLFHVELIVGKQYQLFSPATGQAPVGCDTAKANNTWYCKGYGASSCTLSPCIRTYRSTIEAGKINEVLVSTDTSLTGWGYHPWPPPEEPQQGDDASMSMPTSVADFIGDRSYAAIDVRCLSDLERQLLVASGYIIKPEQRWLPYNFTSDLSNESKSANFSAASRFPGSMLYNGCMYAINEAFVHDFSDMYLKDFFQATVKGDATDSFVIEYLNGSQSLQAIYNWGNISFERVDSKFKDIADAITKYIRLNAENKLNRPAKGVVIHSQTCLSVRWAWLAFSVILVLMHLIFFVLLLVTQRLTGERVPIWKSSPLALIYNGIPVPKEDWISIHNIPGMEYVAKSTNIRLSCTKIGSKILKEYENSDA